MNLDTIPRVAAAFALMLAFFYLCEFPFLDPEDRRDMKRFITDRYSPGRIDNGRSSQQRAD
jgi:hypothetical protein